MRAEPYRLAPVAYRDTERAHLPVIRAKHRAHHERLVALPLGTSIKSVLSRTEEAVEVRRCERRLQVDRST